MIYKCNKCGSDKTCWHSKARERRLCNNCGNIYSLDNSAAKQRAANDEIKTLRAENARIAAEVVELEASLRIVNRLSARDLTPPKWLTPKIPSKKEACTVSCMLSDLHFDEVVKPREINYVNGYDRKIATRRLKLFFENVVKLSRDHMAGVEIDGLVLNLGGDIVSGNIHDELRVTNEDGIMGTIVYWTERLIAGIDILLDNFSEIYIPCVTGNHGRNSIKPIKKGRVRDNFDWLIYKLIESHYKSDKRITMSISEGTDQRYSVYKTRYQLTHGDQFKGGAGISGIWSPIKLGDHRKRQRELATNTPYDILLMGHFHQLIDGGNLMINGSLKGYDEYAASMNFGFEVPQQWLWLTHPMHGKTITAPVHVYKSGEGWEI